MTDGESINPVAEVAGFFIGISSIVFPLLLVILL